jgi:hypothetical protein
MDFGNLVVIPLMLAVVAACGWAALLARQKARVAPGSREAAIWVVLGGTFLLLTMVKANGLVAAVEGLARSASKAEGLYASRRTMQLAIAGLALVGGLAVTAWCGRQIAQRWKRYRWTMAGAAVIVAFAVVRAVSLHEIDAMGMWLTILKVSVESGASVLATWGAFRRVQELRGDRGRAASA